MDVRSSSESAVLRTAFIRAGEALGLDEIQLSAVLGEQVLLLRQGHELLQTGSKARSRVLLLIQLHQSLLAVVGDEGKARNWLDSPNSGLSGRPRDLIKFRTGLEEVVQYLYANRALI
ncbi:MbcA/ParS/Xre antitoxin family protein [Pseudomonas sp. Irchel s3b5]|uniref:antitoxin Xre/MbcA/ParS toxin-binding domain-containing protein n=1 Tax=Pseudomonas sp. Irchel s3b5 TaxID=2009077 RepID=UPI000BA3D4D7